MDRVSKIPSLHDAKTHTLITHSHLRQTMEILEVQSV